MDSSLVNVNYEIDGDDDDEIDILTDSTNEMVKAAVKAVARDAAWQDGGRGGSAAGWLADQMSRTDMQAGRISAEDCAAAWAAAGRTDGGCRCPEGKSGKVVHMGWTTRGVEKVITKYQDR